MADNKKGSKVGQPAGGMSKKAAVEKGLAELGNTATPTQLQKHIRERYRIEMSLDHISTAKAKILKAAGQQKPAVAEPNVAKPTTQKPAIPKLAVKEPAKAATRPSSGAQGISLRDIETVKDLVERVGPSSLKKLIDVMAR